MNARKVWLLERFIQDESRRYSTYLLMVATLGGILVTSRFLDPTTLPELCLFKLITGFDCMFCGLTRAFHEISLGNFQEAISYHPLAPLVYLLVVFHLVIASMRLMGLNYPRVVKKPNTTKMFHATFVLFTLFWILRNLVMLLPDAIGL